MTDDSVTRRGDGHPEYSGKSVTVRGEERLQDQGPEPGRRSKGRHAHPERPAGTSTGRDVSSVRPLDPVSNKMPNLR
jgi:hypothetical protein